MKVVAILLLAAACALGNQTPPGTKTRPILTDSEAAHYTKEAYLQGWTPPSISTSHADYTVGSGHYGTIQEAVNAAIKAGGTTRKYIKISAGTYKEVVYIPSTNVPLTLFGGGSSSSDTVITLGLSANTSPSNYKNIVNPSGARFHSGDPAYSLYNGCASKSGTIGTSCSTVFWVRSAHVQIVDLTIENTATDAQAVALQTNADQVQVHNCRLLGHQDTLCAGSSSTSAERSIFTKTYILGDIDFVFGGGSAIFDYCVFKARGDRRQDVAVIFAPDTNPSKKYGYLVHGSTITGDSNWSSSKKVQLARAWDMGVSSASAYVPGTSPNGQLVIRESTIDLVIPTSAPYTTATSGRTYSGNIASNRNLDDNHYNRFWEYKNTGNGA